MLPAEGLERPSLLHLSKDRIGIDLVSGEHGAESVLVAEITTLVMAEGEERAVDGEEGLGELVSHDDPDAEGEAAGVLLRLVEDGRLVLASVGLAEREGEKVDLKGRPRLERCHEMLVGIAGEGAAVVPRDRECW